VILVQSREASERQSHQAEFVLQIRNRLTTEKRNPYASKHEESLKRTKIVEEPIAVSQAADSFTALGAAAKNSCTGRANCRNWAPGTAIVFHLGEITRPSAR
jgi:hypothetical protein